MTDKQLKFKFAQKRTDYEIISDKVVAAMETGNQSKAREVLAEFSAFESECLRIRREVVRDYGYRL